MLEEVKNYAQKKQSKGQYQLYKNELWNHIIKIDPQADKRNMHEVIRELDARGCLILNSDDKIEFDPSSF